ncbi:tRNA (adenine(58)-N(1))-methyltransferase non-catalytic subunit TRM6-like [Saccostrea echinata]|uniref:tRNA (adenine(58)-N(1))-methyltransferase non-catalytic subunit TRM6-like n=1 Tax=Saccostrea echinata TaxID=191078 RepID=UPI002A834E3C|nr:tRNA (adenine(58)-N(1))-methyltransferase non-catalytic subunit TRM6-like [Saccostrea echinata]
MATSSQSMCEKKNKSSNVTIKEGDHVILKKGKTVRVFQIRKKRDIWLDKIKFTLDGAISHVYGSNFEVKSGQMHKIQKTFKEAEVLGAEKGTDNRNLHDLDSNQKLSREDIEKMKKEGAKGEEIIGQLIENSTTFKGKTEFAQEKWVKKKKQKHVAEFTVLKPNTRLMCQMYHEKSAAKILNIRMDTLAQILTYGNVHAYTNVAVVDTCSGLVVGAVMERLGGYGKVIHFHPGDRPVRPILDNLDFPKEFLDNLYNFPFCEIDSLKAENSEQTNSDTQSINLTKESLHSDEKGDNSSDTNDDTKKMREVFDERFKSRKSTTTEGEEVDSPAAKKMKTELSAREANKVLYNKRLFEARELLLKCDIDCLIIASKYNPTPLVTTLIEYVATSRPVVVYSQYKEAVMDAYAYLREMGCLVNYRVSETWLREYQILPMRTHPVIQMSAGGGYLLTATTTVKKSTTAAAMT